MMVLYTDIFEIPFWT